MACLNCAETIIDAGCGLHTTNARCVTYDPSGITPSGLLCFLGVSKGASLEYILEELDQKLCNIFDVTLIDCFKQKFDLTESSITLNSFLEYLQVYLCSSVDVKVKASANDTTSGYLFDKIVLGDCLEKSLVDVDGAKQFKISINFPCLSTKIPLCFEVESSNCFTVDCTDCGGGGENCTPQPLTPVISYSVVNGKNVLSCTNCNGNVQWLNHTMQIIGTGNPYTLSSGGGTFCAKSVTQCGESEYSNELIVPETLNYVATRTANFTRNNCGTNNCGQNCIGTSVQYSQEYGSTISQDNANYLSEMDTNFNVLGQQNANTVGNCICPSCNCVTPVSINFSKTDATCNGAVINANGSIVINGISNANRYSFVINKNTYDGVTYENATPLGSAFSNATSTNSTITINNISSETIYTVRIFNQENACYKDIVVYLNTPVCSGASITIDNVAVSCNI